VRKSIVSPAAATNAPIKDLWRDLERIARVEISSEDPQFPIEHALGKSETTGWRAAGTGPQLIRLHFDEPQAIKRIHVHFVERSAERSQEFAVYAGTGAELKEIVRQQWSFSPHGSTEEIEDFSVNLSGVTTLEVRIDPDRSHDPKQSQTYASLQSLKLA
jgi:Anaphase-promoting complex, subunit 10 (APC10)